MLFRLDRVTTRPAVRESTIAEVFAPTANSNEDAYVQYTELPAIMRPFVSVPAFAAAHHQIGEGVELGEHRSALGACLPSHGPQLLPRGEHELSQLHDTRVVGGLVVARAVVAEDVQGVETVRERATWSG